MPPILKDDLYEIDWFIPIFLPSAISNFIEHSWPPESQAGKIIAGISRIMYAGCMNTYFLLKREVSIRSLV